MTHLFKPLYRVLFVLMLLSAGTNAWAQLEFTVTGGATGAQPIAIVPFSGNAGLSTDVAKIIHDDLERSGLFRSLPREDMLERPSDPAQVNFSNWKSVAVENVVIGQVNRDARGGIRVRFFLLDVLSGEQRLAFEMPPAREKQLRYTGHQIADLIFEKLIGIPGVFNTKIAYVASSGLGLKRTYKLMISDWDGYNPRMVASSREPLMSPAWSPDRKRLAYVGYERGRSSIFVHTLATGRAQKVVSEKGINGSPAWSPDGRKLAVTLSFENNPDIYVIDIASGRRTRLTTQDGIDTEPAWSPDGQNLVYTSDRGGQPQIYMMPASGGASTRMTFEGRQNLRASFSPDGESLTLVNLSGSSYRIGLLDVKSRKLRLLSDGRFDEGPSFAPNGAVIIYAKQASKGAVLATVSTDGRVRQRLSQTGDVREPAWSPLHQKR
ncbi:MAG: Tol-Pal system beta propeller repeat protein TolB [Panacagrimonas sp.]